MQTGVLLEYPGGALAVTSVREALASVPKDPLGTERGVPDRGSTVPRGQAGWPYASLC